MMAPDPLRSAMRLVSAEDTSLALPTDDTLRTGQRRVLDQVHTIKRTRSKHGMNGTLSPSPTSSYPQPLSTYEFGTFKFAPSNGTYSRTNSSMSTHVSKGYNTLKNRSFANTLGRSFVSKSAVWENNTAGWNQRANGLKPSRSDPALVSPLVPAPQTIMRGKGRSFESKTSLQKVNRHSQYSVVDGGQITSSQSRLGSQERSQFLVEGKMGTLKPSKFHEQLPDSTKTVAELTLQDAIRFLSNPDEKYQRCGATFIQHTTYKEAGTKQQVLDFGGIPHLVTLMRSPDAGVSQAATGALRNLVFEHHDNKLEVQHCSGIAKALQLLKETDSTDTQKQITGLLWNMSASDEMKPELIQTALPALTENVVVPFTGWSEQCANNNIHPKVFYNATGCLRNLSCFKQKERNAMRECRGLIDSLMSYMQSCVAEDNPDDLSVENCACILHNLTYHLDSETDCFSRFGSRAEAHIGDKTPPIGCFSPRSGKIDQEHMFGLPEDSNPSGVKWLTHTKAMQTYLSLLGSSKKDATLEACGGALQNLTASKGQGSSAMSHVLVERLGALLHIPRLLRSPNVRLQKTAMSLLGNMSRTGSLRTSMGKQILPELTNLLSNPDDLGNNDEMVTSACNTVQSLLLADPENNKKFVSPALVTSLSSISQNPAFPSGSKAASLLLYSLWDEKNFQKALKKQGLAKSVFVNDVTTGVHNFYQNID